MNPKHAEEHYKKIAERVQQHQSSDKKHNLIQRSNLLSNSQSKENLDQENYKYEYERH